MKKNLICTLLLVLSALTIHAQQQLQKGDEFEFTNENGITKTYTIVGENLVTNPSFDDGTDGWLGGDGKPLGNAGYFNEGGIENGAYIVPANGGKGSNNSIGTAWTLEMGKKYVFSYFIKQVSNVNPNDKEGYIVTSQTNTPQGAESMTIMFAYVGANCAWTQNIVVTTAQYSHLQFCARWLGSGKGFDEFLLAEVEEKADPAELETLLAECETWLDYFTDPVEVDTFQILINKAWDLIGNGNYKADELNRMVLDLKNGALDFRMANADENNLVDVTDRYITNPRFDNGLSDWYQNNSNVNNGTNCRPFTYFGEFSRIAEITGQPSQKTYLQQTVKGLPKGYYRFTVDAVVASPTGDGEKSGVAIFANGAELDMSATGSAYADAILNPLKNTPSRGWFPMILL